MLLMCLVIKFILTSNAIADTYSFEISQPNFTTIEGCTFHNYPDVIGNTSTTIFRDAVRRRSVSWDGDCKNDESGQAPKLHGHGALSVTDRIVEPYHTTYYKGWRIFDGVEKADQCLALSEALELSIIHAPATDRIRRASVGFEDFSYVETLAHLGRVQDIDFFLHLNGPISHSIESSGWCTEKWSGWAARRSDARISGITADLNIFAIIDKTKELKYYGNEIAERNNF